MFADLEKLAPDPILGVTIAFRADPTPDKVDLGVGVYRDAHGQTPIPAAVREAERAVLSAQTEQDLRRPARQRGVQPADRGAGARSADRRGCASGWPRSRRWAAAARCALAPRSSRPRARSPWSTSARRPGRTTNRCWAAPGSRLQRYPYYDAAAHRLEFERMLDALGSIPPGNVVLLHGCCHNPTGADLAPPNGSRCRAAAAPFAHAVRGPGLPGPGRGSGARRDGAADHRRARARNAARDLVLEELRSLS